MNRLVALSIVSLLLGCAGGKGVKPGGEEDGTPPWLSQGTGAVQVESGKKLQGVGVARNSDPRLRRQAADAAAARQLQGAIDALAAQAAKLGESTKVNAGEGIAALARNAAQAAAHVRDHWVTPDGAESALDQIELGALKQAVQGSAGDEGLRRELAGNLDRAFDQLARK